ncbi:MAG: hypothetical protein HWD62_02770 [Cyclobacteriaceae bacterium]|nr:MAG: hypothetical protein HWD62_02770 [Cyclobacteriaceae bacterium]
MELLFYDLKVELSLVPSLRYRFGWQGFRQGLWYESNFRMELLFYDLKVELSLVPSLRYRFGWQGFRQGLWYESNFRTELLFYELKIELLLVPSLGYRFGWQGFRQGLWYESNFRMELLFYDLKVAPAFAGVLHRQLRSMPVGEEPQQGWRFYEAGEHEFDFCVIMQRFKVEIVGQAANNNKGQIHWYRPSTKATVNLWNTHLEQA